MIRCVSVVLVMNGLTLAVESFLATTLPIGLDERQEAIKVMRIKKSKLLRMFFIVFRLNQIHRCYGLFLLSLLPVANGLSQSFVLPFVLLSRLVV